MIYHYSQHNYRKMKKTIYLPFIILMTMMVYVQPVQAQDYVFKVLANNGNNQVKKDGTWKTVKIGTGLTRDHTLKVAKDTYIGLVHNTGSTMAIDQPGNYKVDELAQEFTADQKSVAGKYAEFVIEKMTSSHEKQNNQMTGAVERSEEQSKLEVLLPQSVEVYSRRAILRWIKLYTQKEYRLTIKNMFDEVIKTEKVSDNQYTLDFSSPELSGIDRFIVQVETTGEKQIKSNEYIINRVDEEKAMAVKKELADLKAEFSNAESSALDQMILASFFENKGLPVDALTHYEEAVKLAPKAEPFKTAYRHFIVRNNLGDRKYYSLDIRE